VRDFAFGGCDEKRRNGGVSESKSEIFADSLYGLICNNGFDRCTVQGGG
jgi:hypothetical protein